MNKLFSAALGLALIAGSAATAAAQATTPQTTPPAAGARHGGGKHGGHGMMGAGHGQMGERMQAALFKGIDLTADQKARIKQIHERYAAEGKSLRESARPDVKAARDARRGGDTTAAKAAFARTADERQKMRALHERAMADVRAVLTPAQQQKFDANLADMKARREAHQKEHGGRMQRQG